MPGLVRARSSGPAGPELPELPARPRTSISMAPIHLSGHYANPCLCPALRPGVSRVF